MLLQCRECRIRLPQRRQDAWRFAVLAKRQVTAIAARVGDDLVGFVQRLGDVQGFLCAQAELLRTHFLQRTKIEWQRRHFTQALCAQPGHPGIRSTGQRGCRLLCDSLIEATVLVVTGLRGRTPLRGECAALVPQQHVDGPVGHGHEVGNAAVAVHHQAQRRRLHPADGQHPLITGLASEQGEQATHVHADQPVGPRTAQRRVIQAERLGARL
ncbi:hypothetical protein D3C73_625810 [compost metagenome]